MLVEPTLFLEAGFGVTIADVADAQFPRARQAGIKTHQANIETDTIPGRYDVVCCLEVLEHLMDPLHALKAILANVAPGGRLFVSLPEEFDLVTRLKILAGNVPFSSYDAPHVRFFTLRAAMALFQAAGVEPIRTVHLPLMPPRLRRLQSLGRALARLSPSLFSRAHLFELSTPPRKLGADNQ
jgi:SAM-dependent methyltransferase